MTKARIKSAKKEADPKILKDKKTGQFVKGTAPGPGRPRGSISIMGRIKQIFEEEPELFETYVRGVMRDSLLRRELIHQIDGKPKARIEVGDPGAFDELDELSNDELALLAEEGEE